jgi:hypothetical protein
MGHSMDTNDLIRRLANISDIDQQSVFLALSRFPSIHQPILEKATSDLVNTFELQQTLPRSEGAIEGICTPRRSRRLKGERNKTSVLIESSEDDKSKDKDFEGDLESSSSSTEDTSPPPSPPPKKKVHSNLPYSFALSMDV